MNSPRQIRCLALVTDAFGGRGGIAQYNRDFLRALATLGAHIEVLPRWQHGPAHIPDRIRQASPKPRPSQYITSALWVGYCKPAEIVFCGHLWMAPVAALIAYLKRAKLIVQMHGTEAWTPPSFLWRRAVETADLVLCVSRYTRAHVLGWMRLSPERLAIIPNTVGDHFKPGDGVSALREKWAAAGQRVLLTVGRLNAKEQYKGHDRVIRALPKLVAQGHDIVYIVIGEGGDQSRLQSLAKHLGMTDRVRFLGGFAPMSLVDAYRAADLFVMPSTGEGFGIVFLEAMACGTPALGLDADGSRDALADGALGAVVSEAELPNAIAYLLAAPRPDPWELHERVHGRFGRPAFLGRVNAALEGLLRSA